MKRYKVYFIDNTKVKVHDLSLVRALRIKKVKKRKLLIFWKKINWQSVLSRKRQEKGIEL